MPTGRALLFISGILDRITEDAMMYLEGIISAVAGGQGFILIIRIEEGAKYKAWIRRCTMLM